MPGAILFASAKRRRAASPAALCSCFSTLFKTPYQGWCSEPVTVCQSVRLVIRGATTARTLPTVSWWTYREPSPAWDWSENHLCQELSHGQAWDLSENHLCRAFSHDLAWDWSDTHLCQEPSHGLAWDLSEPYPYREPSHDLARSYPWRDPSHSLACDLPEYLQETKRMRD